MELSVKKNGSLSKFTVKKEKKREREKKMKIRGYEM